jgi:hypothetical protein
VPLSEGDLESAQQFDFQINRQGGRSSAKSAVRAVRRGLLLPKLRRDAIFALVRAPK